MTFNPDESRDSHGRWTAGGAGAAATDDPRTLDVGGDEWNKKTAIRLEKEYAASRAAMDTLAREAADKSVSIDALPSLEAQDWDGLGGDAQSQAQDEYIDNNMDSALSGEEESWRENDGDLTDAKRALENDNDWKHEALTDFIKEREENGEPRIPFAPLDLSAAVRVKFDGDGKDDPEIVFDDTKLQHPDNDNSPDQLALPGIDAPQPEEALTDKMREDITQYLTDKFNEKAEDERSNVEAPEYLKDSAKEYLEQSWDQMDDDEKYAWTKQHTSLIEQHGGGQDSDSESGEVKIPETFDPMNETSGEDYRDTQRLARYLSTARSEQLLAERGIKPETNPNSVPDEAKMRAAGMKDVDIEQVKAQHEAERVRLLGENIAGADHSLWDGWKSSSTTAEGKLIQVAAHEEFQGRLNTSSKGINVEESKKYAEDNFKEVGGYDGVKALMRAKWETTQYMLDRADMPMIDAYRGIRLDGLNYSTDGQFTDVKHGKNLISEKFYADAFKGKEASDDRPSYTNLPDIPIERNGASSWTTDREVANNWVREAPNGVVLRAQVPRTSVISVPAYGVNMHSEHEIVVLGTAWKEWDAWYKRAPDIKDVAMKPYVAKAHKIKMDKAEKEHVV